MTSGIDGTVGLCPGGPCRPRLGRGGAPAKLGEVRSEAEDVRRGLALPSVGGDEGFSM